MMKDNDNKNTNDQDNNLDEEILNEESKLLVELEELKKLLEEKDASHKRALADYINLKKRSEEEKFAVIKFANEVLLEKFISIFNDLEEAQKHMPTSHPELVSGSQKVVEKFKKTLESEGIEIIDPINEFFDSNTMEAIESVEGEKDKIIKVYRKGYKLNDKVIVTAMVAVGKGS